MKYYAVIDTNVLVSAFLTRHPDSATVKVLNAISDGLLIPLYNQEIQRNTTRFFTVENSVSLKRESEGCWR